MKEDIMKVGITKDEWWPVYSLSEDITYETSSSPIIEIPIKLWNEYVDIDTKFSEMNEKLSELYKANTK